MRKGRQDAWTGLDQQDLGHGCADGPEVAAERAPRQLGDGAGELHAGRAGADHHEGEQPLALDRVLFQLRRLEGQQDAGAQLQRILEGLESGGVAGPIVVTEVAVGRAGGEHQVVVGYRVLPHPDLPPLGVDGCHLAEQHAGVLLMPQDGPCRGGDLRRRQAGGGHLIEQRLEQVMIEAVDHRDLGRCPGQGPGGGKAAESGADDDDPRQGHCELLTQCSG